MEFLSQNPHRLLKYFKSSRRILQVEGYQEKEMEEIIFKGLTEESKNKLKNDFGFSNFNFEESKTRTFSLEDVEAALQGPSIQTTMTLKEELQIPQQANEDLRQYVKRLQNVLKFAEADEVTVNEFFVIFKNGIHPSINIQVRTLILEQMERLPRDKLKVTVECLDDTLKVVMRSSSDPRKLIPKKTCSFCRRNECPDVVDLNGIPSDDDE